MPKKKKTLKQALKGKTLKRPTVWKGPESNDPQGGITQSLLAGYICCKERFRLLTVLGLKPADEFSHALQYGNMWHLCEEVFSGGGDWQKQLLAFAKELRDQYPMQQQEVEKWYQVCKVQFSTYVNHWEEENDVEELLQEEAFCVPYTLPSGRVVYLRGKWDSAYKEGVRKVVLKENKTKGLIKEEQIEKQLTFDLQTMLYVIALRSRYDKVGQVLYNVVRRPLAGGKHSIRQHKPTKKNPKGESSKDYYARLKGCIEEDTDYFFLRWKVNITKTDMKVYEETFLQPCLEELCNWWDLVCPEREAKPSMVQNYRTPFGIWNPLFEGRSTSLDNYLQTGDDLGLQYTDQLFPELQDV